MKQYRRANKAKLDAKKKVYYDKNKERLRVTNKTYREANKGILDLKKREYILANKEKVAERKHKYYLREKDKIAVQKKHYNALKRPERLAYNKSYYQKHRDHLLEMKRASQPETNAQIRKRARTDPVFNLQKRTRCRLRYFVNRIAIGKSANTETLVGMNWEDLVEHLNNNDRGLKVGDPGVHVDHILPLIAFKNIFHTEFGQKCACNWRNLQLLPASENISKSAKYDQAEFDRYVEMFRSLESPSL